MSNKTTGQERQDRLNAALRANLKRRKQQGRVRGATALPIEERPSLMNGDAEKLPEEPETAMSRKQDKL